MSNKDLKKFIHFHAKKASIRTTFKALSDQVASSSRASSVDLISNLESTPVSIRQSNHNNNQNTPNANTSLNSFSMQGQPHVRTATKNDYLSLSYDFKPIDWSQEDPVKPLSDFDVIEQESLLINDLLYVLVGIEGKKQTLIIL